MDCDLCSISPLEALGFSDSQTQEMLIFSVILQEKGRGWLITKIQVGPH